MQGDKVAKIKVGLYEPIRDGMLVSLFLESVPDLQLRLDANRAWDLEKAKLFAKKIKPSLRSRIQYIEEPCHTPGDSLTFAIETGIAIGWDETLQNGVMNPDFNLEFLTGAKAIVIKPMLIGNIAALKQDSLKRMLAYSSISHSGYALVGIISAGLSGGGVSGASGTIFYIFAYSIMTLGTFGFICLFEKRENTLVMVSDIRGLAKRSPWTALAMTVLLLSLAGIPPTVGFFGKFYIFASAVETGLIWLAVWGVLSSVISVYYYLRPIVYMYMSDEQAADVIESKQLTQFSVGVMATLVVFIGLVSDPFYKFVLKSVSGLF